MTLPDSAATHDLEVLQLCPMRRYEAAEASTEALERPYHALARLLNCGPEEVAILQSATLAWQQVFFGLNLSSKHRVLTSVAEYGTNFIAMLQVSPQPRRSPVLSQGPSGCLQ